MIFLKRTKKFVVGLISGAALFTGVSAMTLHDVKPVSAATTSSSAINLTAKAALAIDADTGQVIYEKNADTVLPIASMTKLISIDVILDQIKSGKLTWDQKVTVDDDSYKISQDTSLSNVPLSKTKKYTVKELYDASLIYSANGAIMALAHQVSGSQKDFVTLMRAKVKSWGINDAKIDNVSGLTNSDISDADRYPGSSAADENELTAKDMGLIAKNLLKKYPEVLKTTSIKRQAFDKGTSDETLMENWNWMLPGLAKAYTELPVDGLKTGTSDKAGECFTGTVKKDGHRIITVVLGSSHKSETDVSRFTDTQKIMSYVFDSFDVKTIKAGTTFKNADSLPVFHGKELTTKVALKSDQNVWLKKGETVKSVVSATVAKNTSLVKKTGLEAPIKANSDIGTLKLTGKDGALTYVDGAKALSVTGTNEKAIEKANIFVIMWRAVANFFKNLF